MAEAVATKVCTVFNIEGGQPDVCKGAVHIMGTYLLDSLANGPLTADRVCGEFMQLCSSPVYVELNADDYVKKILAGKPEKIKNNDYINGLYKKIMSDIIERSNRRSI